ncbi:MAG TPA: ABC transporter permease [Candidatus Acidoferrales bacterium]|nr:ABC transporter permease [Candidatus Acidoferrales bacterium]
MNIPSQLRLAARGLRKSPGFTAATILTLALGIGLCTAIFSVAEAVLLQPLRYHNPDRLALVWKSVPLKNIDHDWTSYPTYQDWKRAAAFEDLTAFLRPDGSIVELADGETVEQIQSAKVSANFFNVMNTAPQFGHTFTPNEVNANPNLAVISFDFWKGKLRGTESLAGKHLTIDGADFEVIGVMPAAFEFPAKDSQVWSAAQATQIWIPINSDARWTTFQKVRIADAFGVIGRLKSQASIEGAQAEMNVLALRLAQEHADTDRELGIRVISFPRYMISSRVRLSLWLLLGAVGCVLLIACANAAGLSIARAFARRRVFAVQMALGAGRLQILAQTLAESLLICLAAGTAGTLLAGIGVRALRLVAPPGLPGIESVSVNARVLVFAAAISLLAGILSGAVPAWKLSAADPQEALRERSEAGGRGGNRARGILVSVECALAIILLAGTGLLLRSALRVQRVDLGFRPDHLLDVTVRLHGRNYQTYEQMRAFADNAIRNASEVPGVRTVAAGSVFLGRVPNSSLQIEGRAAESAIRSDEPTTWTYVSENFFRTLGIPLVAGREFSAFDGPKAPQVVIVNQHLARRLWPGENAVGKRFKYGVPGAFSDWLTVVGVAGDTVRDGPETAPISVIYFPIGQRIWESIDFMVRTDAEPERVAGAVREAIHRADRTVPIIESSAVQAQLWRMGAQRRFQIELLGLFSAAAMALSAVGLYGLMAFAVTQRTREIGVRMALGARRGDVMAMMMRQGFAPAIVGVVAGTGLALIAARGIAALLFGVSTADPAAYASAAVVLLSVAATAVFVPVRRAMRVDPMVALRHE